MRYASLELSVALRASEIYNDYLIYYYRLLISYAKGVGNSYLIISYVKVVGHSYLTISYTKGVGNNYLTISCTKSVGNSYLIISYAKGVGNCFPNILADFLTLRLIKYLLDRLNAYNFISI